MVLTWAALNAGASYIKTWKGRKQESHQYRGHEFHDDYYEKLLATVRTPHASHVEQDDDEEGDPIHRRRQEYGMSNQHPEVCYEHFIENDGEKLLMKKRVCAHPHYRDMSIAQFGLRIYQIQAKDLDAVNGQTTVYSSTHGRSFDQSDEESRAMINTSSTPSKSVEQTVFYKAIENYQKRLV